MKRRQQGFSILEGLLILVIIGILGFTGWYVYHSQKNADSSYNNSVASSSQTASSKTPANSAGQPRTSQASGCSLALTLGQKTGAAGTFHMDLIFTNKGTADCALTGYPVVTLVDAKGNQIGQQAANDTSVNATTFSLKPKASAYAGLSLPDPGVAPNCLATQSAEIASVLPGISGTLKAADTTDQYCPNFMTRPLSTSPSS